MMCGVRYIEYRLQKVSWRPVYPILAYTIVDKWIIEFQIIEVPLYNQWDFADVHPTVGSCSLLFCRLLREKPNCSVESSERKTEKGSSLLPDFSKWVRIKSYDWIG